MRKNYKLDGYSLSAVSQHFIDDDKVDLPYQMIWEIWNKGDNTPKDMQKLGIYCIQDTLLPLTLIEKLSLIIMINGLYLRQVLRYFYLLHFFIFLIILLKIKSLKFNLI